jgi:hypothetical protein
MRMHMLIARGLPLRLLAHFYRLSASTVLASESSLGPGK